MDVDLVIWDAHGRARLESDAGPPRVFVPGGAAVEPPSVLLDAVERALGFSAALVRVAAKDVAEVTRLDGGPPPGGLRWRETRMAPPPRARVPWQRPGWMEETLAVVDAELARAGLRRTGPPVQTRHTSVTGMLCLPTDRQPVWLKAVLPIFVHEPAVLGVLDRLGIERVPRVIAAGDGWWLGASFPGEHGTPGDHFVEELARVQLATVDHIADLRAAGCPDRPLDDMAPQLARVADRTDLLSPAERRLLLRALPGLERTCAELGAAGIPRTLVHGDLNPENVRHTEDGWFLFDWTDACVAHPFADLALALAEADAGTRARALAGYAARWARVVPGADVGRALRAAPVIGAAHQAVTYRWILDAVDRSAGDVSDGEQLLGLLRLWVHRLVNALR